MLEIRPLIAFRDYHSLTHRNGDSNPAVASNPGLATVTPYRGLPSSCILRTTPAGIEATGDWYNNFEYDVERERGLDFQEDLFNPFVARFDMSRAFAGNDHRFDRDS